MKSRVLPQAPLRHPKLDSEYALADVARKLVKQRQERRKVLSNELFSEPAWDILLDLFVAQADQKQVCVTSTCMATCVPGYDIIALARCYPKTWLCRTVSCSRMTNGVCMSASVSKETLPFGTI